MHSSESKLCYKSSPLSNNNVCFWKNSTKEVLHFRKAIDFINSVYPFSHAFGTATTREECANKSQVLFEKLLERNQEVLHFDDLCKIARNRDGTSNKKKVLELVKLFRPHPNGEITKMEFVKSIDRYVDEAIKLANIFWPDPLLTILISLFIISVYKRLRLVLAKINNSSQIDRACKFSSPETFEKKLSTFFERYLTSSPRGRWLFRWSNSEHSFLCLGASYWTFCIRI